MSKDAKQPNNGGGGEIETEIGGRERWGEKEGK